MIETNIDDMSPQVVEYPTEKLFQAGALDVFVTPIFMKKQRPAFQLSVITPISLKGNGRDNFKGNYHSRSKRIPGRQILPPQAGYRNTYYLG